MKMLCNGEVVAYTRISTAGRGVRCDEVVLNSQDIEQLLRLYPLKIAEVLSELQSRFYPGVTSHKAPTQEAEASDPS